MYDSYLDVYAYTLICREHSLLICYLSTPTRLSWLPSSLSHIESIDPWLPSGLAPEVPGALPPSPLTPRLLTPRPLTPSPLTPWLDRDFIVIRAWKPWLERENRDCVWPARWGWGYMTLMGRDMDWGGIGGDRDSVMCHAGALPHGQSQRTAGSSCATRTALGGRNLIT